MRTAALVVCKIFSSKKNGSDQVSVLVLAVVREEERPRCFLEIQTHTAMEAFEMCTFFFALASFQFQF